MPDAALTAATKPKCRWHQYSLRTLFVAVTLLAIPCWWIGVKIWEAGQQRDTVMAIQRTGGSVRYKHEIGASGQLISVDNAVWYDPADEWGNPIPGESARGAEAPVPACFRRLLGEDFFRTAVWASVGSDDGLKQASLLTGLTRLTIDPNCRIVQRDPDVGTAIQATFHDTRSFYFVDNRPVTDAGLQSIKKLTHLEELVILFPAQISNEDVAKLQQALPNCKIHH